MSRITNYEAVAEIIGHWLHRAQVSLLTGAFDRQNRSIRVSNQVSHPASRKLVPKRGWCVKHTNPESQGNFSERPECHSKTEAADPASLQDRSRGAGLAPRPKPRSRRFAEYPLD